MPLLKKDSKPLLFLSGLIALQVICGTFFAIDVIGDFREAGAYLNKSHLIIETIATLTLGIAILLEARMLKEIVLRNAHLEENLQLSKLSLHELVESRFKAWQLTPAEFDVAMFLFKGMALSEIANLRGTSEGTVKAQLSAVYRKANVQNRAELLIAIIDGVYEES